MANTYLSTAFTNLGSTQTASNIPTQSSGNIPGGVCRVSFRLAVASGTLVGNNDLFKLAPIPFQYKVTNWFLDVPALDSSGGIQFGLGDLTSSSTLYASAVNLGQSSLGSFFRLGDTGTRAGIVSSSLAAYNAKATATRLNRDSADEFILKVTAAATTAITNVVRTFYGWVDFVSDVSQDPQ